MRELVFTISDFDLFGQDISPADYEFFKKHTGAFRRMLDDQTREKKQEFVDTFKDFSLNHGCLKECPTRTESRLNYLEEVTSVYNENFVNGRFSTAKNIVMDAVTLAQNKHLLQYMGHKSYAKDPFFSKETRDVFRRLFGLPSENGTFIKVICVLPLHIKFGGSICRYLRRWLDAGEPIKSLPSQSTDLKKTSKTTTFNSASASQSDFKRKEKEEKPIQQFDFELFEKLCFEHETSVFDVADGLRDSESMDLSTLFSAKKLKSFTDATGPAVASNSKSLPFNSLQMESKEKKKTSADSGDGVAGETPENASRQSVETLHYEDNSFEEIKKMMLLNKPHPNDQILNKKLNDAEKAKKRHACSNCRKVEPEPKTFKKCQRCRGKGTRFYCSKTCQITDWEVCHRDDHNSIEDVT